MERADKGLAFMMQYENVAWYDSGQVRILDRRVYPRKVEFVTCSTHGEVAQALTDIAAFDICRAHGIIIAESAVDTVLPAMPSPYTLYREYRYGKIKLTVYHRGGNEDTE